MRKKHTMIIYYAVLLCMIVYVVLDLQNSAMVGNNNSDRMGVYIMLGALILLTGIRDLLKNQRYYTQTEIAFLLILVWVALDNVILLNLEWTTYIHIGLSLLWYLLYKFFFNYDKIGHQTQKNTQKFFMVILCVYVVALLTSAIQMREEYEREDVVLNTAYYVLIFLPVVLTFKKKYIKIAVTTVIAFCIFWTFKRGAIIALFAMLLCYFYTKKRLGEAKSGLPKFLIIASVLLMCLKIVDEYSGGVITERFSWDSLQDGSGRNTRHTMAISYLKSCDFITILTGGGAGATARILGGSAHNEWLEFIICYGVIGVLLYFNLLIVFLQRYLFLLKQKMPNAAAVGMLLVYWVCVSLYGAIYFIQSTIFVVSMLGLYSRKGSELI